MTNTSDKAPPFDGSNYDLAAFLNKYASEVVEAIINADKEGKLEIEVRERTFVPIGNSIYQSKK